MEFLVKIVEVPAAATASGPGCYTIGFLITLAVCLFAGHGTTPEIIAAVLCSIFWPLFWLGVIVKIALT